MYHIVIGAFKPGSICVLKRPSPPSPSLSLSLSLKLESSHLSLWLIALAPSSLPLSAPVSHCLVSHSTRRRSLGSGLYHGLWSRTQSRSRAFPTLVVAGGRSSWSWDWSSLSYPVSSPSRSQSRTYVALVAGDSSLPPASFEQPEAGPNLLSYRDEELDAIILSACTAILHLKHLNDLNILENQAVVDNLRIAS
ncbi:uncharacterized protein DS421_17g597110 [Arachis hypogaea]|nr:uncharacterized protein DS421_17g597110 [Arachis hypogaea]